MDAAKDTDAPATMASKVPGKPAGAPMAPKTGPGSVLAFMADQSEVHREVVRLRERLGEFDGAQAARRIDPKLIRASGWANRDMSHFKTEAFASLKEEIASAGGNVQPIKVRPIEGAAAGSPSFESSSGIVGIRRAWNWVSRCWHSCNLA